MGRFAVGQYVAVFGPALAVLPLGWELRVDLRDSGDVFLRLVVLVAQLGERLAEGGEHVLTHSGSILCGFGLRWVPGWQPCDRPQIERERANSVT